MLRGLQEQLMEIRNAQRAQRAATEANIKTLQVMDTRLVALEQKRDSSNSIPLSPPAHSDKEESTYPNVPITSPLNQDDDKLESTCLLSVPVAADSDSNVLDHEPLTINSESVQIAEVSTQRSAACNGHFFDNATCDMLHIQSLLTNWVTTMLGDVIFPSTVPSAKFGRDFLTLQCLAVFSCINISQESWKVFDPGGGT